MRLSERDSTRAVKSLPFATRWLGGGFMSYEETLAQILNDQGIPVDASAVPGRDAVEADLQRLRDWLGSLEDETKSAIDEATAENAVQAGLADPEVSIVQDIGGVLAGFDNQQSAISISSALDMIAAASAAADQPPNV
jgi:hypothetical protein